MNTERITHELETLYPGKNIILLPPHNPTEIICETDPSSGHPEYNTAIAIIDSSAPHLHKVSTETYTIIKGVLQLFLNGKKKVLTKDETYTVTPYTIHWARGDETWARVYSTPGWDASDHILIGKEEEIHISPYDPAWPEKFEKEKRVIEKILGSRITGGIHHVGSTAVPGLSAKPVIDIMAGVQNLQKAKSYIDILSKIHYQYFPYKPEVMHWFCKPSLEHRTHHLYLMEPASREWNARLAFRDYLRTHPGVQREYETLKSTLAMKFRDDREKYTEAKTEFIKNVVRGAGII
jgi:GrpB-like predicted nucleotidyltransferase (UPF0157 family)/mannose-6-phosphate isomerase-like protein (cupin superfamily)